MYISESGLSDPGRLHPFGATTVGRHLAGDRPRPQPPWPAPQPPLPEKDPPNPGPEGPKPIEEPPRIPPDSPTQPARPLSSGAIEGYTDAEPLCYRAMTARQKGF